MRAHTLLANARSDTPGGVSQDVEFEAMLNPPQRPPGGADESVINVLRPVLAVAKPGDRPIAAALKAPLRLVAEASAGSQWYFEGELLSGPFRKVDLRLNDRDGSAILVLHALRGRGGSTQLDVALRELGVAPHVQFDVRPEPEGRYIERYPQPGGQNVIVAFTDDASQELVSATVTWPPRRSS
jgi:hypothetical protein